MLSGLAAIVVAGLLLAGCASSPPPEDADTSANVYLNQKPVSFNPLKPPQAGEQLTMSLIFDNLFTTDPDFKYTPRLAKSWDVSDDAKTFTFHLREGLTWSDGKPFSADDVLFTYNLQANPKVGGAWGGRLSDVEGYAAVKDGSASTLSGLTAPDKNTVVFQLSRSNAGFLSLIGYGSVMYILPKHVLGEKDPATLLQDPWFTHPTTGMGPYTVEKFNVDQDIELKANSHFRTNVGIDHLYLKMLTSDVATAQLGTGEIDLAQVSALDLDAVKALPGVEVSSKPSAGFNRVAVNSSKPQFADERVRQGMLYAIDRKGIIDGVLGGEAKPLNSDIMTPWALPKDLEKYSYDPKKAKQLLTDAGFDFTQEVKLSWVPGQRDRDQIANVIIENLKAAGVNAVANQVEVGALLDSYKNASYDLALFGGGVYTPDPASSDPIIACGQRYPAGGNTALFCNSELDEAMAAGRTVVAEDERAALYQKAATLDNELVPYLWLNVPNAIWATSDRLKGFEPHGDFTNGFWNAADWTVSG
ncbi:ABC transporter substrate-binding protein [Microbacterium arabinogalactanolyticum]|uniref:ABC transporter substrate-binding protein n=1 Tax=Microbacterium arabinogalactanolyticum TaxID=69365 RepID=UPI004044E26B